MQVVRLFVSSTFQDFGWERATMQGLVPALNAQLAPDYRVDLVDLQFGVSFESGLDQNTVEICLREARACVREGGQPAFLMLVGQRLGWRPLPVGLSLDHFDAIVSVLRAAGDDAALALLGRAYVRDDNALDRPYLLARRAGDWIDPQAWEAVEATLRAAVLQHRAELPQEVISDFDSSITELEVRAALDLQTAFPGSLAAVRRTLATVRGGAQGFLDSSPEAIARLDALWSTAMRVAPESSTHLQGTVDDAGRLDESYRDRFVAWFESSVLRIADVAARNAEDSESALYIDSLPHVPRQMEVTLRKWVEEEPPSVRLLFGASGSGKTSVVRRFLAAQRANGAYVRPLLLGQAGRQHDTSSFFHQLGRSIVPEQYHSDLHDTTTADQVESTFYLLTVFGPEGKKVVCVDAVELVQFRDPHEAAAWLPRTPIDTHILVTTADERIRKVYERILGSSSILELPELDDTETRSQIVADLAREGRQLQSGQLDVVVSSTRVHSGRGVTNRLATQVAAHLAAGAAAPTVESSLQDWLVRYHALMLEELGHGEALLDGVLSLVAVSRFGIPEHVLYELLATDSSVMDWFKKAFPFSVAEKRLPRTTFSRLLRDLRGTIEDDQRSGGRFLSFCHRSIGVHIDGGLANSAMSRARSTIARYADTAIDESSPEQAWCLKEVLFQRLHSADSERARLEDLVTRFDFVLSKLDRDQLPSTFQEVRLLEQRKFLSSPVLEQYVALLRYIWAAMERLTSPGMRHAALRQAVMGLYGDNPLRAAMLTRSPEIFAERILRRRFAEPRLSGLTLLDGRYRDLEHAQLFEDELVLPREDGSLVVVDTEFGLPRRTLRGHPRAVLDVSRVHDDLLLTCGRDGYVALSSIRAGRDLRRFGNGDGGAYERALLTQEGALATSHERGHVCLWSLKGEVQSQIDVSLKADSEVFGLTDAGLTRLDVQKLLDNYGGSPAALGALSFLPSTAGRALGIGGDVLPVGGSLVATIGHGGFGLWSVQRQAPSLLILQTFASGYLPARVLFSEDAVLTIVTTAGSIHTINLVSGVFSTLQGIGPSLPGDARGRQGGVFMLGDDRLFAWAIRTTNSAVASVLDAQSGSVQRSMELHCKEGLASIGFFRGGLSSTRRGLIPSPRGAYAWSVDGAALIDFDEGTVASTERWSALHTSAVRLSDQYAFVIRNSRSALVDLTSGVSVADFTQWFGNLNHAREMEQGRVSAVNENGRVVLWEVDRSLEELSQSMAAAWSRPVLPSGACAIPGDGLVVRRNDLDVNAQEFEVWSLASGKWIGTCRSHGSAHSSDDFIRPSGLGAIGPLALTWGCDGSVRIVDQEEVIRLVVEGLSRVDFCAESFLLDQPGLFCIGPEGARWVLPGLNVSLPVESPGGGTDGPIRRVASIAQHTFVWTRTCLWHLRAEIGATPGFRPVLALDGLLATHVEWTVFPNRLSRASAAQERSHGFDFGSNNFARISAQAGSGDPTGHFKVIAEDEVGDDILLDLADASITLVGDGKLLVLASLSRNKEDGEKHRVLLAMVHDDGKVICAASLPDLRPELSVSSGVILRQESDREQTLFVAYDREAKCLTLSPVPTRCLLAAPVRGPGFPIESRCDTDLVLRIPDGATAELEVIFAYDRVEVHADDEREMWFSLSGGYRILDIDLARRRVTVAANTGECQVLDLPPPPDKAAVELKRARLLRRLGKPMLCVELAQRHLNDPQATATVTQELNRLRWFVELGHGLLALERLKEGDDLLQQLAAFANGSPPLLALPEAVDIPLGIQRLSYKVMLMRCAEVAQTQRLVATVFELLAEARASQVVQLVEAALDLIRTDSPWLGHLERLCTAVAERRADPDERGHCDAITLALQPLLEAVAREDTATDIPPELAELLSKAQAGDAEACHSLGVRFGVGDGVGRSYKDAAFWYREAMNNGHAMGAFNLAQMYRHGEIEPMDDVAAFEAMRFAAENGVLHACLNLANMYREGRGCAPDVNKGLQWLEHGRTQGDETCAVNMAVLHAFGMGVPMDDAKAIEAMRVPLRNGNPQALRLMAEIERRRQGDPP